MSARIRMYHASVWRAHSTLRATVIDDAPSFRTRLPRLTPETMGWWRRQRKRWNKRHQRAASRRTCLRANIPCLPYPSIPILVRNLLQLSWGYFCCNEESVDVGHLSSGRAWNAQHEARSTNTAWAAWAAGAARRIPSRLGGWAVADSGAHHQLPSLCSAVQRCARVLHMVLFKMMCATCYVHLRPICLMSDYRGLTQLRTRKSFPCTPGAFTSLEVWHWRTYRHPVGAFLRDQVRMGTNLGAGARLLQYCYALQNLLSFLPLL